MADEKQAPFIFRGRFAARFAAIQALYQLEREENLGLAVVQQFLTHHFEKSDEITYIKPDTRLFQRIVLCACEHKEQIDQLISQFLNQDWRLERIDSVVRAILKAATCELLGLTEVPAPVVINEYINVTKEYFTGKEVAFVNGTLDNIAKHLASASSL